jgi:hypothetical protein
MYLDPPGRVPPRPAASVGASVMSRRPPTGAAPPPLSTSAVVVGCGSRWIEAGPGPAPSAEHHRSAALALAAPQPLRARAGNPIADEGSHPRWGGGFCGAVAGGHRRSGAAVACGRWALLVREVPEALASSGEERLPHREWARKASRSSVGGAKLQRVQGLFSSALARDVQRAISPAVNWFWRMYAFCSSCFGLLTPLRRRSIECASTRAHRPHCR